jgi:Family of unknown function (DUF6292)
MEWNFDDEQVRGLRGYARSVAQALGAGESFCLEENPVSVYLAVDGSPPGHPDCDFALVWDEPNGWSAAVEAGGDLTVVARLGGEVLPPPEVVSRWAEDLLAGAPPERRPTIPHARAELARRLTDYAPAAYSPPRRVRSLRDL